MRPAGHFPCHSYDEIAEQYAAIAEPLYFVGPARDLVALLNPPRGARLLDCGSGSGAVARAMLTSGPAWVAACDVSLPMVRVARSVTPQIRALSAVLPHLPFRDASFDAAALGFVLSHVGDVGGALREIARVVVGGGRIGVSSWSMTAGESEPGQAWSAVAQRFAPARELEEAGLRALPSEAALATPEALRAALEDAGLSDVRIERQSYPIEIPVAEYARSRLVSMTARYLAGRLSAEDWSRFERSAEEALVSRFGVTLRIETVANFAAGAVPLSAPAPGW